MEFPSFQGMLKKAASGVRAVLPTFGLIDVPLFAAFALSRTKRTLRASQRLRPCWTDFFEHSLPFIA